MPGRRPEAGSRTFSQGILAERGFEPPGAADQAIAALGSGTSLDQLTFDAGIGARHLRRACLERAGVSPKYFQRILRFRAAAEKMNWCVAQPNWAQFEFQEFSGPTPGRFLQSLRAA